MPDIGARIKLEGEAQYKQALRDIAAGQKVMRSEMELVSATFEGQEKSVDALKAKHDVLERTLNGEREKLEVLRGALQRSAEQYGESDSRTQKWQEQLNRAQANAAKLEHQIDRTDKELGELNGTVQDSGTEMENLNGTSKGLGDVLDGLAGKFGISLPENMRNSINGMASFDKGTLAVIGGATALVTALVKVEKQLASLTKEQAAAADELLELSAKTDIATDRLQEYAYAAELIDTSVETITGAQTKLIKSMDSARDGAKAQVEAFEQLGVAYRNADGTLRSSDDVFWDVIDALGQIESASDRDAVAMDLLGKSARDLNPLIKAGSDEMKALAQEAHDVGYVLSTEQVKALAKVDDATQRYQKAVTALRQEIAVEFAPYLEKGTKNLTEFITGLGKAVKNSGVVDALGMIFETITNIISPADRIANKTLPSLQDALHPLAITLAAVADTLDFISGLVTLDFGKVGRAMGLTYRYGDSSTYSHVQSIETAKRERGMGTTVADLQRQWEAEGAGAGSFEYWLQKNGYSNLNGYNASGNVNWRGGVTWVGENGPERVYLPAGTQIQSAQDSRVSEGDTINVYMTVNAASLQEVAGVARALENMRMNLRKRG